MKKGLYAAAARLWKDIKDYRWFILGLLVYDLLVQLVFHEFCPMVIVTGLPCPGCGMTRAIFYFATGRFVKGWAMNPLGILWLLLILYFIVMRYCLGKKPKGVLQIGGVLAACMLLYYGYRMYRYFPSDAPICYTEGNLLERMFLGYRELVPGFGRR